MAIRPAGANSRAGSTSCSSCGERSSALGALDGFDLGAAERMGAIGSVLGHVFGSGPGTARGAGDAGAGEARTTRRTSRRRCGPTCSGGTEQGRHPQFIRWANDPGRFDPAPQSFERVLDWLLDGIQGTLVNSG